MSEPINIAELHTSMLGLEKELQEIKCQLESLTKAHEGQEKIHADLMELYENVKGFLTVLGWLERMVVILTKLGAAGAVLTAGYQFFVKNKGP